MTSSSASVRSLRDTLDAFHANRAVAELLWWRRGEDERPWQSAADALLSERGAEWLHDARSARELSAEHDAAVVQQLAWVAAWVRGAGMRPIVCALLAAKVPCGSDALQLTAVLAGLTQAGDASTGALHARALSGALDANALRMVEIRASVDDALVEHGADLTVCASARAAAERFLAQTEDATRDLVGWLLRSCAPRATAPLHALVSSLRRPELDRYAPAPRRMQRLAAGLCRLGFERDLHARVRVEPAITALLPAPPRAVALVMPGEVHIAVSARELGVLSDFDGAAAIGVGLAHALVSPALTSEQRWPLGHALPETLAGMMLRWRADRLYLRRVEGFERRDAEVLARHGALLLLLATRASAAIELAAAAPVRDRSERSEAVSAALSRALTLQLPAGAAALSWASLPPLCSDLRGKLASLSLHLALRERFDEDWFNNPRAAEPLRGACARGNTLGAEAFCAELGCTLDMAAGSLLELLA